PSRTPLASPLARRPSAAAASASASASSQELNALTRPSTALMRAEKAWISSTEEICLVSSKAASCVTGLKISSALIGLFHHLRQSDEVVPLCRSVLQGFFHGQARHGKISSPDIKDRR